MQPRLQVTATPELLRTADPGQAPANCAPRRIPGSNTPGCSYTHFPLLPILRACRPLPANAADLRGLWIGVRGGHVGHVERIEQCGARTVVTAAGIIHDYGPNSTAGLNTDDTEGAVLFTVGDREFCPRTSAAET